METFSRRDSASFKYNRRDAMTRSLYRLLCFAAAAISLATQYEAACAQAYPSRQVRIVVGFPPGGTTDIVARLIGQWLAKRLGQPFVVDNRPGANTIVAAEAVARSPADGYTILVVGSSMAVNATLYEKLSYDSSRDFVMIAGLSRSPLVLEVHPSLPVRNVAEFIAYASSNGRKISMASYGTGSISHVAGELFKMATGVKMIHIPYRGSAPMLVDLLGGQVDSAFDNLPASFEHMKAHRLRGLAITSAKRLAAVAELPAMNEFLPGYEADTFIGIAAPKGTPAVIINTLNAEVNAGLATATISARLTDLGGEPLVLSSAAFEQLMTFETNKWRKVIRSANIKPE
jgi:tripartite-type tricarboxylate transporter receptor subunit TctC